MTGMLTFPLGVHKLTTSAYSPSGNDGTERVYHTMAKILAMDCNENQMTGMHTTFPLDVHKLTMSVYSPSGNGGVELVYHTVATILAMVCNEHQTVWNAHHSPRCTQTHDKHLLPEW